MLSNSKHISHIARASIALLVSLLVSPFASALAPGVATPAEARPDRIIIKLRSSAADSALTAVHARLGTKVKDHFMNKRGAVVTLPPGLNLNAALTALRANPAVEYAEPDYRLKLFATPNDFRYLNQDQWNLHNGGIYGGAPGADIAAEAGWDLQHDASDVVVAIIDSGIRYTHEDIAANMWTNPGETGLDAQGHDKRTNGIDDDGDGYIDDVYGANIFTHDGNVMDDVGHGTHVAGIVGAVGNNGVGVTGVAWRVKLMAVKFIDASLNYSVSDAVLALEYARAHGARIVTASWGGYNFTSQALYDTIASLRSSGIIVTAAAGNDNNNNDLNPLFPASYALDNIVSVAATNRVDGRAPYSNYGANSVHLGAPGSPVFSTTGESDNSYGYSEGTSLAAPHVAGACALLWARFPNDSYSEIIQRVLSTVDPLPELNGITRTNGRLNLAAALATPSGPGPLNAPSAFTATAQADFAVALSWTDNATAETGFIIEKSTDNVTFTPLALVVPNTTAITFFGLPGGAPCYFRVRAVQNATSSGYSNVASATPHS